MREKKKNNVTISCTIFYPLIMSVWTTKPKRYSYVLVFGWIFFTQIKILAWNNRVSGRRRAKRIYELNIRVECRHTSQWEIEVIIFVGHLPAPGENVWSSYWNARNCVHVIRNTGGIYLECELRMKNVMAMLFLNYVSCLWCVLTLLCIIWKRQRVSTLTDAQKCNNTWT